MALQETANHPCPAPPWSSQLCPGHQTPAWTGGKGSLWRHSNDPGGSALRLWQRPSDVELQSPSIPVQRDQVDHFISKKTKKKLRAGICIELHIWLRIFEQTIIHPEMASINLDELCVREVMDRRYLGPALLQCPAVVLKLGEASLRLAHGHLLLLAKEQLCGLLLLIQDLDHAGELAVDPQGRLLKIHLFGKTHVVSHKHDNVNADLQFS